MSRAPHRRGSSTAAVLLIAVLALGQLGAFLHATTLHARCPEHGELVHGAAAAGADPGVGRGVAAWLAELSRTDDADGMRGLPDAGNHEHEHCLATCATRERATAPAGAGATAERMAAREVASIAHVERAVARALYRTAPKTSPPV
jgi:hypothetical protein